MKIIVQVWILIMVVLAVSGLCLIIFNPPFKFNESNTAPSIRDSYWNEVALVNYLADKYNISQSSGGRGKIAWSEGDKDFLIQCETSYPNENTFRECCKEGEVSYRVKYDDNTIKWLNVTRDTCE